MVITNEGNRIKYLGIKRQPNQNVPDIIPKGKDLYKEFQWVSEIVEFSSYLVFSQPQFISIIRSDFWVQKFSGQPGVTTKP